MKKEKSYLVNVKGKKEETTLYNVVVAYDISYGCSLYDRVRKVPRRLLK